MLGSTPEWDRLGEGLGWATALGCLSLADGGAFPAMPSGHDCHAPRQVSPQQDGCAQQVQGESLGALQECLPVGVPDSLCISAIVQG